MSGLGGDKARFNRRRRQKELRRVRNRALLQGTRPTGKETTAPASKKSESK
jgi:hypothetical protein